MKQYLADGLLIDKENKTISYDETTNGIEFDFNRGYYVTNENLKISDNFYVKTTIYSIFKRNKRNDSDGNKFIYVLKNKDDWKFASEEDKNKIGELIDKSLEQFCNNVHFDAIWTIPSSHSINQNIALWLHKHKPNTELFTKEFQQYDLPMVMQQALNKVNRDAETVADPIQRKLYHDTKVKQLIKIYKIMLEDGKFSMKKIHHTQDRKLFQDTFCVFGDLPRLSKAVFNKDLLVIDDLISSNTSITNGVKELKELFEPKSISVFTLLSKNYK